jgi:hypothetical protein
MSDTRVPQEIGKFNQYITRTNARLVAINPDTTHKYSVDYGLTTTEADSWTEQRDEWVDNLYPKYNDPLTSTSVVKGQVRTFMETFTKFAEVPLIRIQIALISGEAEEQIFNIVINRSSPHHPTEAIDAGCYASIRKITSGKAKISCRSAEDSRRSSIYEKADSIQYSYKIVEANAPVDIDPDDESMTKAFAKQAIFNKDFGAQNQGKWLIIYFRWFLLSYPQFAGAWSSMQRVVIG